MTRKRFLSLALLPLAFAVLPAARAAEPAPVAMTTHLLRSAAEQPSICSQARYSPLSS